MGHADLYCADGANSYPPPEPDDVGFTPPLKGGGTLILPHIPLSLPVRDDRYQKNMEEFG